MVNALLWVKRTNAGGLVTYEEAMPDLLLDVAAMRCLLLSLYIVNGTERIPRLSPLST